MAACGQLKRGTSRPCILPAGGLKQRLVLIRQADIVAAVRSATLRKAVTGLSLTTGKKGFLFEGIGDSNVGRVELSRGKYGPRYKHEIDFASFANDPANLETVEDLAQDTVVAVVPASDGFYKIYGLGAGLVLIKDAADTANADVGGGSELTLSSDKEGGREDILFVADEAGAYDPIATRTLFETLFTAPVI